MTFLERLRVSRKTPGDGRLLVTAETAARLADMGTALTVERDGERAPARLQTMACTCEKGTGEGEPHVHHFVESLVLRALAPESEVSLALDEAGSMVRVEEG